jgi:hypothetical protein
MIMPIARFATGCVLVACLAGCSKTLVRKPTSYSHETRGSWTYDEPRPDDRWRVGEERKAKLTWETD